MYSVGYCEHLFVQCNYDKFTVCFIVCTLYSRPNYYWCPQKADWLWLCIYVSLAFAPCKNITLYLLCFFLVLFLSFISLSLGIALSTISIEICVLSLSLNGNSNIFFITFFYRLRAKKSNRYLYCKNYLEINTEKKPLICNKDTTKLEEL